jgi:predicted transcriptional regulator
MSVKTAISINETLFEQVNKLADELKVSRSYLFVMAVEEFIERYENHLLLEQLNRAYDDPSLTDHEEILRGMRRHQRNLVEGEW